MPSKTRKRSQSAESNRKRAFAHGEKQQKKSARRGFDGQAQHNGQSRASWKVGRSNHRYEQQISAHFYDELLVSLRKSDPFPEARAKSQALFSASSVERGEQRLGPASGSFVALAPSRSYKTSSSVKGKKENESETKGVLASHLLAQETAKKGTAHQEMSGKALPQEANSRHLDPWQQQAFDLLIAGSHVVVDAPTSAGKTRVIEALLDAKMSKGLKLIYTSPVKSLSNDKYREFTEKYGKENVGINTGDFKENLGAPIILATLETYRNSLLGIEPDMSRKVVVYDEYHYLQDESRGSAWEESIVLTPKGSQLVLLSASVPNAEDFAEWISQITNEDAQVVRVTKRPVPLVDVVHTKNGWLLASELKLSTQELDKIKTCYVQNQRRMKRHLRNKDHYTGLLSQVVEALAAGLGPIVVYAARRADVESLASSMMRLLSRETFRVLQEQGSNSFDFAALHERLETLSGWEYVPDDLKRMVAKYGVAFHHSGMIPPARVAIESLLKEGKLRVCMGTMGISLGVNFAVRSAYISDESRPGENGEKAYTNSEILQMLGRAGRRGHDLQGFSLWSDLGKYSRFRPTERERCVSSLKFDPSTVMGIVDRKESYAYLSEFYKKSLFMKGQKPELVLTFDHTLLSGEVYTQSGGTKQSCDNIPESYQLFERGKTRSKIPCTTCPSKRWCHPLVTASRTSPLQKIVFHLEEIGAMKAQKLTILGQLARNFPQSGGLLIASWLANREMNAENFSKYASAMAVFCSAHFKEIPSPYADQKFLEGLRMDTEVEFFYPYDLFPEYYDEVKGHVSEYDSPIVFRELNFGAPSVVNAWLRPSMSWDRLVAEHSSKYFSAGDCMMVLFRFATYLQSCIRLKDWDPDLAHQAKKMLGLLLREPLDARNRMLLEELEAEERPAPDAAAELSLQAQDPSNAPD